jgi:hypothetical protein
VVRYASSSNPVKKPSLPISIALVRILELVVAAAPWPAVCKPAPTAPSGPSSEFRRKTRSRSCARALNTWRFAPLAEPEQRRGNTRRNLDVAGAGVGGDLRPTSIGRELEHRHTGEPAYPVAEVRPAVRALQPIAFPILGRGSVGCASPGHSPVPDHRGRPTVPPSRMTGKRRMKQAANTCRTAIAGRTSATPARSDLHRRPPLRSYFHAARGRLST